MKTNVIFSLVAGSMLAIGCAKTKQAAYLDPGSRLKEARGAAVASRDKALKDPRRSHTAYLDQARIDFYDRMAQKAKERAQIAKEMEKPQYSDPMYFGHQKPPKKNPPGKKRMCSECGMVH